MKEVVLALISFAKDKGLGELCQLLALLALCVGIINSMGYEPLNFGKGGVFRDARASDDKPKEGVTK